MFGIAPIYQSMICVAHYSEASILVYTVDGQLKQMFEIPGLEQIYGMVAIDGNHGQIALVDGKQEKVRFVTLSEDVEILQHSTTAVPMVASNISMTWQNQTSCPQ